MDKCTGGCIKPDDGYCEDDGDCHDDDTGLSHHDVNQEFICAFSPRNNDFWTNGTMKHITTCNHAIKKDGKSTRKCCINNSDRLPPEVIWMMTDDDYEVYRKYA